jgi:hypothetical protein
MKWFGRRGFDRGVGRSMSVRPSEAPIMGVGARQSEVL